MITEKPLLHLFKVRHFTFTLGLVAELLLGSLHAAASQPSSAVLKKICGGTCSGPIAWVAGWADNQGTIRVYEYQGDLGACSHPPRIYFDGAGQELGVVPEFPINTNDPKSLEKAKTLQSQIATWLKGLVKKTQWSCGSL